MATSSESLIHVTPQRIGLVGDVRGSLGTIVRAVRRLAHQDVDTIHFLGDFGMPWGDRDAQQWMLDFVSKKLNEHGIQALVTGGNHVNYDEWVKIPVDFTAQMMQQVSPEITLALSRRRAQTSLSPNRALTVSSTLVSDHEQ